MALTRKFLKAFGIEDEKIDQIIEAHAETVDALKEERDGYKVDAEKLPEIEKKLKAFEDSAEKDPWKVKYDALKEKHDAYKAEQDAKESHSAKEKAYRDILKASGVSEKYIDKILKVSDIDSLEIEDGKVKDSDNLAESIKSEWGDFIQSEGTKGATIEKRSPGATGTKKMTRDEIMKITDRDARRKAIAENMDAFNVRE